MSDVWTFYETPTPPAPIPRIVAWEKLARLLYKQIRDHGCGIGKIGDPCLECRSIMGDYEEATKDA